MRLDKFLAQSALGKRSKVREYIKEGKVKVNNEVVTIPAIEINEKLDTIKYLDSKVEYKEKVYYILNKPKGYITAKKDDKHKTVFDILDFNEEGIFHIGRLDKDTEGMLLFTNDGEFEHKLMDPNSHVEKTYYFWALGYLDFEKMQKLENGVLIGEDKTKPSKVKVENLGIYKEFESEISNLCNVDLNYDNQKVVSGYITISEGKKHQVKRMLKAVDCFVIYLKRVSIGKLNLDETLKVGEYRSLTEEEINILKS